MPDPIDAALLRADADDSDIARMIEALEGHGVRFACAIDVQRGNPWEGLGDAIEAEPRLLVVALGARTPRGALWVQILRLLRHGLHDSAILIGAQQQALGAVSAQIDAFMEFVADGGAPVGVLPAPDIADHARRVLETLLLSGRFILPPRVASALTYARKSRYLGQQLSPEQREVLELAGQGYSSAEIARRLHLQLGSVEGRLARARESLRLGDLPRPLNPARAAERLFQDAERLSWNGAPEPPADLVGIIIGRERARLDAELGRPAGVRDIAQAMDLPDEIVAQALRSRGEGPGADGAAARG